MGAPFGRSSGGSDESGTDCGAAPSGSNVVHAAGRPARPPVFGSCLTEMPCVTEVTTLVRSCAELAEEGASPAETSTESS